LDEFAWNLDECEATLTDDEFKVELEVGGRVTLGMTEQGGVRIGGVEEVMVRQLSFISEDDDWSKADLARWLDSEFHRGGDDFIGIPKAESQAWLVRMLDHLMTARQADLRILVRKRHDLANIVIRRIAAHGRQQVRRAADMLIDGRSPRRLETSMDAASVLEEQSYCPYRKYEGTFTYNHHAFDLIGEMRDEESQCAKHIDDHPNVKRWLRNLAHESAGGFSLPLSPGRFFPDFIVELADGRTAIVEYKGGYLARNPDELHKATIGRLWADRSNGQCVFVWIVDRDWAQLDASLKAIP
jgi:type III restriction enzyme